MGCPLLWNIGIGAGRPHGEKGPFMLAIKGQKAVPPVPPLSVFGLFRMACLGHMDDVTADEDELTFTHREMLSDIADIARALLVFGVKPGDIVTIGTARSMHENMMLFYAANRLGATACFHDEQVARGTLVEHVTKMQSKVLFVYHWSSREIAKMAEAAPTLKFIVNMKPEHSRRTFTRSILETFEVTETAHIGVMGGNMAPTGFVEVPSQPSSDTPAGCSDTVEPSEPIGTVKVPAVPFLALAALYKGLVPMRIIDPETIALISFTSGSSSGPKPLMIKNRNIVALAIYSKQASGVKMWSKVLQSWMSYVHLDCPYGIIVSIISPQCDGGKIVYTPNFSRERIDYYLGKNVDVIFGIPTLLRDMRKFLSENVSLSNLKIFATGGERLEKRESLKAKKFFWERGHDDVLIANCYGTGESLGFITTVFGTDVYRPDTVGYIPGGVHVLMLNPDTKEEVGFDAKGLLCVAGEHVIDGYWGRPDLDEQKFVKDEAGRKFLNTGDLAIVDDDGYVQLVGRATFFINALPAKVYCNVVEAALEKSDLVRQSYVVEAPDDKLGKVAYAFVVPQDGASMSEETAREILETAAQPFQLGEGHIILKDYEIPRQIVFLTELPMTPANKVNYRLLEKVAAGIANTPCEDQGQVNEVAEILMLELEAETAEEA